ncbi:MAG: bifunctional phosphopantothenoylcysteine decarboxylase/phosphopantothenate--cysteine ligase CoaBC [Bacteroidales bacterium]
MLKGKKIIVGITGSIAAYKAAFLTRLLIREGAEVKVIMTPYAREFITPVTMATLSGHTVLSDFFHHDDGAWNSHVDLGIWADLLLIAPATANTIAKMATGIADNLLLTTYLSARCPVAVAPAMDLDMLAHPATRHNLELIQSRGDLVIEPATGELASGLEGKGRMEEPEKIVAWLKEYFKKKSRFSGKRVLITAGPTLEKIDPVRYISNHSSGKMGYALARAFANQGASVDLISGPVALKAVHPGIRVTRVTSAAEMNQAAITLFPDTAIAVMAAAVADYAPATPEDKKIKRTPSDLSITLKPTLDIAAGLGRVKKEGQVLIGFALETDNEEVNAVNKLVSKNLDLIVLNRLTEAGAGFGTDTNRITIFGRGNKRSDFELKPKEVVAEDIVEEVFNLIWGMTNA